MASIIKADTLQSTTANVSILNSSGTEYARFDSSGVFQLANPTTFPAGTVSLPSITATGDTNTGIFFPAADTVGVATGGTERMRIDDSGNVGIGTSTPAERLHVNGNGKVEGSWRVEHSTTTDWNYGLSVWVNRDKTKAFTVNESVTGTNLFTIWGNGVVNAKNIYAEEIEVRVDALGIYWPDYVFKPTYQLRPLSEVASFVATNHHLPDVPSEVEIMEEGLNLGEMDAILLRKIEELTLYMIEQQEEIERLKKLVEESTNNQ